MQACGSIRDGLGKSASALIQKPMKKYQLGEGPGAALATAVRGVPTAAISPVSACAGAVHYAFLGLRNRYVSDSSCFVTECGTHRELCQGLLVLDSLGFDISLLRKTDEH